VNEHWKSVDGYFDWEPLYDQVANRLPPGGAFVEIGCWRGKSLCYLLARLQSLDKSVSVHGVDHFRGSLEETKLAEIAAVEDIESQCRANLAAVGYPFTLIAKPSLAAAAGFPDGFFDCVFIDGSHDFASVVADLRAWTPKVRPGGLLAGHDLNQVPVLDALDQELGLDRVSPYDQWTDHKGREWGRSWSVEL
jgi:hypothetical protein